MRGLTAKVSGPQNAGPLDRRVRPEGQKGAPSLEDGRSPRKTAGPRKRRSAARRIAGGACCTSAGGPKGLKAFGTGRSAGISGCAHETGDGTNALSSAAAVGGRLRRIVRLLPHKFVDLDFLILIWQDLKLLKTYSRETHPLLISEALAKTLISSKSLGSVDWFAFAIQSNP